LNPLLGGKDARPFLKADYQVSRVMREGLREKSQESRLKKQEARAKKNREEKKEKREKNTSSLRGANGILK